MDSAFSSPRAAYRQPTFRYGMLVALLALLAYSVAGWSAEHDRAVLQQSGQILLTVMLLANHVMFAFVDPATQRRYRVLHLGGVAIATITVIALMIASRRADAQADRGTAATVAVTTVSSSRAPSREQ